MPAETAPKSNDSFIEVETPGEKRAMQIISDTIPPPVLIALAEAILVGGEGNWNYSKPKHYYIGAKLRHFGKWLAGEEYDDKDGQHHLAADILRTMQLLSRDLLGSQY